MDTVPANFCERVSALWRCCNERHGLLCCLRRYSDSFLPPFDSDVPRWYASEIINIKLFLFVDDGKWKYGFGNPDHADLVELIADTTFRPKPDDEVKLEELILTADELRKRRDLKRVRVDDICVFGKQGPRLLSYLMPSFKLLDMDHGDLLNCTTCMADDPQLRIDSLEHLSNAPNGAIVKKWIEERWFYSITITQFSAVDKPLMDKEAFWGKPTHFYVSRVMNDDDETLSEYLKSGTLRFLWSVNHIFPFEVLEAVIENFRRSPEDYNGKTLRITVGFDDSTFEKLEEMRRNGLCSLKKTVHIRYYIFTAEGNRIAVEHDPDDQWGDVLSITDSDMEYWDLLDKRLTGNLGDLVNAFNDSEFGDEWIDWLGVIVLYFVCLFVFRYLIWGL